MDWVINSLVFSVDGSSSRQAETGLMHRVDIFEMIGGGLSIVEKPRNASGSIWRRRGYAGRQTNLVAAVTQNGYDLIWSLIA
jgi:hypothetical protein